MKDAIRALWVLFKKDRAMTVSKSEYVAFLMRVCKLVIPDLDKDRAKELAMDDWAKDSRGSKTMSYKHFMDAVRCLVILWCGPSARGSLLRLLCAPHAMCVSRQESLACRTRHVLSCCCWNPCPCP